VAETHTVSYIIHEVAHERRRTSLCVTHSRQVITIRTFDVFVAVPSAGNKFRTRDENKRFPVDSGSLTAADLAGLPELRPPSLMPQGNVGTPTSHFLRLIQQCRLPASVISKLGLVFPRTRSNRKYGCVPFEYGRRVHPGTKDVRMLPGTEDNLAVPCMDDGPIDVKSAGGTELMSERELENVRRYESSLPPESIADEPRPTESDSESDADDCEEWERHEAFQNDPSNQERNKERLFESEMEVVWEKGGPGIVWYTDAQFWEELEGRKLALSQ